jgi:putative ABC transport system permease protein
MFRNYFLTALRNFARHKLYSFINIAGLAVGLACAIFIILFIRDELSFDTWLPDTDGLYLVGTGFQFPGHDAIESSNSPFVLAPTMAAQIPEVRGETHIIPQTMTLKVGDRLFSENVDVVDPDFFEVIRLPLVAGNARHIFAQPESIVLSQTVANKLVGRSDPVNRTVLLDGKRLVTVTGILRDLPHNTQLVADAVIPNTSSADPMTQFYKRHWLSLQGESFVRLAPGSDPARVLAKVAGIADRNIDPKKEMDFDISGSKLLGVHLTPFTAVHLSRLDDGGMTAGGSWTEVYGFGVIAVLILLIACFNFTNLATARAAMRAREVSLRKVMGAKRRQLIVQFLNESVLTALIALALALAAVEMFMPAFDRFTGRPIALHYATDWPLTLAIGAAAVFTGLLGGFYPALILSGFRPAVALKANTFGQSGSGILRTMLVILQFSISIGLGIAAAVVFYQVRYSETLDLGFDRSGIVVLENAGDISQSAREDLARTLATEPSVEGAALSEATPFEGSTNFEGFTVPGLPEHFVMRRWYIDPDYFALYGMKLIAGRLLSRDHAQDTLQKSPKVPVNIVIDAAAARQFGFTPQQAIGKTVRWDGPPATIVGVVADAQIDGPRDTTSPMIFSYNPRAMGEISIRARPGRLSEALAAAEDDWHRFAPNFALNRRILNDAFDRLFRADEQRGRIFAVFVVMAISIACLGLYGLAAFTAERRTREIGIRKVFGARTRDITALLLWQFSVPVIVANVIAWPVAWYYLHGWLAGFAHSIPLSPLYFLAAGAMALAIAWATVLAHALRVARANPVRALRYE